MGRYSPIHMQPPSTTVRQLAAELDLSERRIIGLLRELEDAGVIERRRLGRNNQYALHAEVALTTAPQQSPTFRDFVSALVAR